MRLIRLHRRSSAQAVTDRMRLPSDRSNAHSPAATDKDSVMKKRNRILASIAVVALLGLTALAVAMSHNAECGTAPPIAADAQPMRAVMFRCYGSPEVLRVEQVARPVPADNEVLVRVHAAAVNPLDWHYMRGEPYIMRLMGSGIGAPEDPRVGVDFSGTVEAVGSGVTRFKPGDAVFGGKSGALGEYVAVRQDRALAMKPDNVSFEQAAAVNIAAITALQALRDKGGVKAGQTVL